MGESTNIIAIISQAIKLQIGIDRMLRAQGIRDLVGDYGELLAYLALGGTRSPRVTPGHDMTHPTYGRIQIKTRKYELKQDNSITKETRATGFQSDKPNKFDWLCHIVLDVEYSIVGATLVKYDDVWPEICSSSMKINYAKSKSLPSSIDITERMRAAVTNMETTIL